MNPVDVRMRWVLVLSIMAFYAAMLAFFAVMWLAYNHPNLQDVVLGGFALFGTAATFILGHYVGVNSVSAALQGTRPPDPPAPPA